jgi:hypothetical protein
VSPLGPSLSRIPTVPYLSGRCQRFSNIGDHTLLDRVQGRIRFGLGIKTRVLALLRGKTAKPAPPAGLGEPSRFSEGDWVRVADAATIRATLDARSRTRGLEFSKQQWYSCGGIYRVSTVVRRIIDDGATLRAVSRTVLLDDVDCGGAEGTLGCGRHCPMMFRDEWLEPASAPVPPPDPTPVAGLVAEVRSVGEIQRTLDPLGRREGLLFMPEMAQYAGQRYPVAHRIERVLELDVWKAVGTPAFVLAGLRCTGAVLGADGPCHRRCHLLWHRDWLRFD